MSVSNTKKKFCFSVSRFHKPKPQVSICVSLVYFSGVLFGFGSLFWHFFATSNSAKFPLKQMRGCSFQENTKKKFSIHFESWYGMCFSLDLIACNTFIKVSKLFVIFAAYSWNLDENPALTQRSDPIKSTKNSVPVDKPEKQTGFLAVWYSRAACAFSGPFQCVNVKGRILFWIRLVMHPKTLGKTLEKPKNETGFVFRSTNCCIHTL